MLKYQSALTAGLGALLLVPALASQNPTQGLERSVSETVRALEVLAGIQKGIDARHPSAIALTKQATEPVSGEARERDARVVTLRDEVNRLQAMSDRLQGPGTQVHEVQHVLASPPPTVDEPSPQVIVSTGLSAAAREQLASFGLPTTRLVREAPELNSVPAAKNTPETKQASVADPLRQAQVLYRAERYEECALLLKKQSGDLEAAWWRARALERLGRVDEALACYREAAASTDAKLATRAKQDLEFLEWKHTFARKLEDGKQTATPAVKEQP